MMIARGPMDSSQNNCTSPKKCSALVRPNGSGEWSPGLRPEADALGGEMTTGCGLKGRETCLAESGSRDLSGRDDWGHFSSQGIGLRPQPWAGTSRPVGPGAEHGPFTPGAA